MPFVTPKTGYRLWDQDSDRYDAFQFVGNWRKADSHVHKPGQGVQIPNEGFVGKITTRKLDPILANNAGIGARAQDISSSLVSVVSPIPDLSVIFAYDLGGPSVTISVLPKSLVYLSFYVEARQTGGGGVIVCINEDEDIIFLRELSVTSSFTSGPINYQFVTKARPGTHTYSLTYNSLITGADFQNRKIMAYVRSIA